MSASLADVEVEVEVEVDVQEEGADQVSTGGICCFY